MITILKTGCHFVLVNLTVDIKGLKWCHCLHFMLLVATSTAQNPPGSFPTLAGKVHVTTVVCVYLSLSLSLSLSLLSLIHI